MNKDLIAINDEIELLLDKPPSMDKYQRLVVFGFVRIFGIAQKKKLIVFG